MRIDEGWLTGNKTPTLAGTSDPGSTVSILRGTSVVGTTTALADGTWSFTMPSALADGLYAFKATATDLAANKAEQADSFPVVIDTKVPGLAVFSTISPDTGTSATDRITNATRLTLSGTAEAYATVQVRFGGNQVGTTTADSKGNWTYDTGTTPLTAGAYKVELRAVDRAGNAGDLSAVKDFTVDVSTPAPTLDRLTDAKGNALTSPTATTTVNLAGTSEAGASVQVLIDGVLAGTATATSGGSWSITLPSLPAEGERSFRVISTDIASNQAEMGNPITLIFDRTAPDAPQTGAGSSSGLTNNPVVTVVGTAEAGSRVEIFLGTTLVASTTAGPDGKFNTKTSALADGIHTLKARAIDLAGNASVLGESAKVSVDTKTDKPAGLKLANDTGRLATDGVTNSSAIIITGIAEAGATVSVFLGRTVLGSVQADSSGAFSIDISSGVVEGSHTLFASALDLAGNASANSDSLAIRIDRTAPNAPTIEAIQEDTGTVGDFLTKATKINVSGKAEPDAQVTLSQDGVDVGSVIAGLDGTWSIPVGGTKGLAQGVYQFKARATDIAGNTGIDSASRPVEIDTTVAAPKVLGLTDANGTALSTLITNTGAIGLRGTAEVGSSVELLVKGINVGTATADASGAFTLVLATPLAEGAFTAQARATDRAGNLSSLSATLAFTIDLTAPDAPLASGISPDTGTSATDGLTSSTTPTASGSAEAGSTVEMVIDGGSVVTSKASAKGVWSFALPTLSEGNHQLVFWSVDAAGNRSKASQTLKMQVDTLSLIHI